MAVASSPTPTSDFCFTVNGTYHKKRGRHLIEDTCLEPLQQNTSHLIPLVTDLPTNQACNTPGLTNMDVWQAKPGRCSAGCHSLQHTTPDNCPDATPCPTVWADIRLIIWTLWWVLSSLPVSQMYRLCARSNPLMGNIVGFLQLQWISGWVKGPFCVEFASSLYVYVCPITRDCSHSPKLCRT